MGQQMFANIAPASTITAIEPLRSDSTMRRVRVGGKTIATVRAADMEAMELAVGLDWTEQLAQKVQRAVETHQARGAALWLLNRRAYSCGELIDRLARKGHSNQIAGSIAQELATAGLIDDEAYARAIARETVATKPASQEFLARKLRGRRIDDDLAQRIALETLADVDLVEATTQYARKRLHAMPTVSRTTATRRIVAALARRGFDADTIAATLGRLNQAPLTDQPAT